MFYLLLLLVYKVVMFAIYKKIYCDFDGTISKNDCVTRFLSTFADKKWLEDEELWVSGKISARECLVRQVDALPPMSEETLQAYINTIEIDEHFIDFYNFLKAKDIQLIILSDGFDLFIKKTLERYGLEDIEYHANSLKHMGNRFSIEFCNYNENCKVKSGCCKCSKILEEEFCYIGDGTSDFCIAKKINAAKKLFAKGTLENFCVKMNIPYIPYNTFGNILETFKKEEERCNI